MNTYFCSTPESDGPFELDGRAEKRDICKMKPLITSILQTNSPQHFKVFNEVAEKAFTNPAEMQDSYNNHIRWNFASLDDIAAGQFKTPTSLCDQDYFAWKVWLKW